MSANPPEYKDPPPGPDCPICGEPDMQPAKDGGWVCENEGSDGAVCHGRRDKGGEIVMEEPMSYNVKQFSGPQRHPHNNREDSDLIATLHAEVVERCAAVVDLYTENEQDGYAINRLKRVAMAIREMGNTAQGGHNAK